MQKRTGLSWTCATCGEQHDELPALAFAAPDAWHDADRATQERDFELTADECIWNEEHFFVRCVLELPFIEGGGCLHFGIWSSLSRASYERFALRWDDEFRSDEPPMFGWLSNSLPEYPETLNIACKVHLRDHGLRPVIELEPTDHLLAVQQREGISRSDAEAYAHRILGPSLA